MKKLLLILSFLYLVIKKDSQYENYNNKWYDYTEDSYIQYALNYLHRRYAK